MKTSIKFGLIATIALFASSCNSGGGDDFDKKSTADTATKKIQVQISEETLNSLLESIPSPMEMSSLLKESGAQFDNTITNPAENADKYTSSYAKALNIGIYSADLGYLNMYGKSFATLNYLGSIKSLASGIQIGQFFDFEMLKKLATNSKNMDSIMYISTNNFNKMDAYLRSKKRAELSVLIISGAWLEGEFISTQIAKTAKSDKIEERIGEQKITLDNLMVILDAYKSYDYFNKFYAEMQKLKSIYDSIKIEYEYHEPETKEVNGQLVIVNESKSKIMMTKEQLKAITETTAAIRAAFIK